MTTGQLAAVIAAGFFALLACAGIYVLVRMGRLIGVTTDLMTSYRQRADTLLDQAQAVVDRTSEQLARTDSITASMDEVTTNMAELSGHVSAMTGVARALTSAVGAPVTGISAVAYGVRRAVALRRDESPAADQLSPRSAPPVPVSGPGVGPAPIAARPAGTMRPATPASTMSHASPASTTNHASPSPSPTPTVNPANQARPANPANPANPSRQAALERGPRPARVHRTGIRIGSARTSHPGPRSAANPEAGR